MMADPHNPPPELDAAVQDVIRILGSPAWMFWDRREQEEDLARAIQRRFSGALSRLEERARHAEEDRDRALQECERLKALLAKEPNG